MQDLIFIWPSSALFAPNIPPYCKAAPDSYFISPSDTHPVMVMSFHTFPTSPPMNAVPAASGLLKICTALFVQFSITAPSATDARLPNHTEEASDDDSIVPAMVRLRTVPVSFLTKPTYGESPL